MNLSTKKSSSQVVTVTTGWAIYSVIFNEDLSLALVNSRGLEEEFNISFFPPFARSEAIAAYLIAQLEIKSQEG